MGPPIASAAELRRGRWKGPVEGSTGDEEVRAAAGSAVWSSRAATMGLQLPIGSAEVKGERIPQRRPPCCARRHRHSYKATVPAPNNASQPCKQNNSCSTGMAATVSSVGSSTDTVALPS
ncbi:hypothetical protein E2562_007190 [Oryza meyeriana var. granulata]|uniref:Uncharacterized protein n=1 Tax=Oryza meyeriana var. granulata TaxID=110450 RepID=A0A6G1CDW9_9ORYZ|nr:hypothetical protein E2562_007190 [Oryza meyeriana var. granulata]